jgi:hypothetical protein
MSAFGPEAEVAIIRAMPVPPLPAAREEFAADIGVIKAINKAQGGRYEARVKICAGHSRPYDLS